MTVPVNRRVLLIDDTHSIHEDFRKILAQPPGDEELARVESALFGRPLQPQGWCFELDCASCGEDGVALAAAAARQGHPYAVAFVDMRMPGGWDGVETVERLWATDPRLQVVICTAYADHPWGEVLARLDVRDRLLVVKKPFDLIEVSQLARTLAAKWDLARQSEQQIERLRRSHGELEAFAHSLSHDLRAPLTAMSAFAQLLATELGEQPGGKARHYLERILANARQGSALIDALLLLDKVTRAECLPERLDLASLAQDAMEQLRLRSPARRVAWHAEQGLVCHADPRLLRIVLAQLMDNAWKFTAPVGEARIELAGAADAAGEPGMAAFCVRDNGVGFDPALAADMFSTPQRLHPAEGATAPGIGLVVAQRAVARHGGRLWAESAPGQGAAFYFTLPAAAA